MTVGTAIRQERKKTGKSIDSLAPELGVARNTLAMYERGERLPGVEFLARLAQRTGGDFGELVRLRLKAAGIEGIEVVSVPPVGEDEEAAPDAFVSVPVYDVRAAAETGALVESEEVETEIAFRGDWLRRTIAVPPERLGIIRARGDSMEPTIRQGDLLLLELEPRGLLEGEIYVVQRKDVLLLKRVQILSDGSVILHSDNPDWPADPHTPERGRAPVHRPGPLDRPVQSREAAMISLRSAALAAALLVLASPRADLKWV